MQKLFTNKNTIRCAIYTRKSVEEGLNAEYTSLDAQRQICEEYIKRQEAFGWVALPQHYDDGGYSGGNMNRPAMKQLLEDVDSGLIDVIVVYKVDRLSRSLLDFTALSAHLEQKGVSFVLVTQNVDTTTTMGRMQLNLLMTFAQYEREMCSDRIKDKMTAMKSRGMWTGGTVPYGYDCIDRKLIINPVEAKVVQRIFNMYIETGSPHLIAKTLNSEGIYRKKAGVIWRNQTIYKTLDLSLYRGIVHYNGVDYKGVHEPIISDELWEKAQAMRNIRQSLNSPKSSYIPLLAGLLYCTSCHTRLTHAIHFRGEKVYRYYCCPSRTIGVIETDRCKCHNIPAERLECEVLKVVLNELARIDVLKVIAQHLNIAKIATIKKHMGNEKDFLSSLSLFERHKFLTTIIKRIDVDATVALITLDGETITGSDGASDIIKEVPLRITKVSSQTTLALNPRQITPPYSKELRRVLTHIYNAREWKRLIEEGKAKSLADLSHKLGYDTHYVTRRFRLAYLSPRIVLALMYQEYDFSFTIGKFEEIALLSWREQEESLGMI